jgi:predicted phage-related endonuclease
MKAEAVEEAKENLRTFLIAKAAMLDRSSQEEVDDYNKIQKQLTNLTSPEKEIESKNVEEEMKTMFNQFFRDSDGKPKPISVKVGDAYDQNQEFDNYLSSIPKDEK